MAGAAAATIRDVAAQICGEIEQVFARASASAEEDDPANILTQEILTTARAGGKVVLLGMGREGLMMKALCMRLFHLGIHVACVGDMTCPAVRTGDLLVASAGPGAFATVDAVAGRARSDGCRVVVVTAQPGGSSARHADAVAVLPATTMADDVASPGVLPMGSVFEGALFVLSEMVVLRLMQELGQSFHSMRSNHTNLE